MTHRIKKVLRAALMLAICLVVGTSGVFAAGDVTTGGAARMAENCLLVACMLMMAVSVIGLTVVMLRNRKRLLENAQQ